MNSVLSRVSRNCGLKICLLSSINLGNLNMTKIQLALMYVTFSDMSLVMLSQNVANYKDNVLFPSMAHLLLSRPPY